MESHSAEDQVRNALQNLNIDYEIFEIDSTFSDTVQFCEKYQIAPEQTCNTIVIGSKREPKQYVVCVVLAHTKLDVNKRVRGLMGVPKVSFATAEEMHSLTGMAVGGVTPLALPPDLTLYVDARIMECDWIVLGGGGRSIKVKISPQVFTKLNAQIVQDLGVI